MSVVYIWVRRPSATERNGNVQERFNGTLRAFQKPRRRIKSTGSGLATGFLVYDFVRPHMALKERTPAQKAGIIICGFGR